MIVKDRGKVSLIEMSIHALRIIVSLYSLFTSAVDLESTAFVIIAVAIPQILSTLGKKDPNRLRAISIALASSSAQGYIPKIINIASILATIGLQKHQDQITSTITAAIVALIPPPLIYIFAAAHSLANSFVDETDRIVSIIKLADSTAKAVELEDEIEEPSKSQLIRVTKEIRNCSVSRNRASALLAIKKAVSLLPESQKHMGTLYQEMWREIRDLNHETTFQQMLRSITSIGITTSMTVLVAKNALGDSFPITCTNHSPVPPGPDPPNPKPKPTPDPVDEDEIEKEVAERVGDQVILKTQCVNEIFQLFDSNVSKFANFAASNEGQSYLTAKFPRLSDYKFGNKLAWSALYMLDAKTPNNYIPINSTGNTFRSYDSRYLQQIVSDPTVLPVNRIIAANLVIYGGILSRIVDEYHTQFQTRIPTITFYAKGLQVSTRIKEIEANISHIPFNDHEPSHFPPKAYSEAIKSSLQVLSRYLPNLGVFCPTAYVELLSACIERAYTLEKDIPSEDTQISDSLKSIKEELRIISADVISQINATKIKMHGRDGVFRIDLDTIYRKTVIHLF